MIRSKVIIIYLMSICLLLAGCWDLDENERMFYVHGLGIDFKDGNFEVALQIISFSNVAKSDQTNQDLIQSEVTTFTGKTPDEAFTKTYNALAEKVFWGHFSFFIIGEGALKNNRINYLINDLTRFSDTRYNTWVYVTDEPLNDFLLAVPLLKRAITLTKLADPRNSHNQISYVEPLTLRKLILHLNEPSHEANIPYVRFKTGWQNQKGVDDQTVETGGAGVVSNKEFKGYLIDKDADGLKWLNNESIQARVTSTLEDNSYFSVTAKKIHSKIVPIINGNSVQFDLNISLNVALGSFSGKVDVEDIKKHVIKQVEKEVNDTYKKGLELEADVYKLSEILYRKDVKLLKKLAKDGNLPLTEDSIRNINITIQKVESGRKSFEETIE